MSGAAGGGEPRLPDRLSVKRRVYDALFLMITGGAAFLGLGLIAAIFLAVLSYGAPALSWGFLSEPMRASGEAGGIIYQIIGTGFLAGSAALIALPLALALALFRSEYVESRRLKEAIGAALFLLNGVPSIIFGVVGYFVIVRAAGMQKSWLAGGIVLAFMILPTVTIAVSEAIRRIPRADRDAAIALGLNRPKVIWSLVLPASRGGLITGLLLGLARSAGETAPIMFTAAVFSGAEWPEGIVDSPVTALPYHILNLAQDASSPKVLENAWGAALVLLGLALLLSLAAWYARERQHREVDA